MFIVDFYRLGYTEDLSIHSQNFHIIYSGFFKQWYFW